MKPSYFKVILFCLCCIVVFVVKTPTPTSTQHNPKTTSTDVGFDVIITLQPPHHPTPPPHRNSTLADREYTVQCKLTQY